MLGAGGVHSEADKKRRLESLDELTLRLDDALQRSAVESERYEIAATAVLGFLMRVQARKEHQEIFHTLLLALGDLRNGRVHPIFKPTAFGRGRTVDDTDTWVGRALTCLTMRALRAAKHTPAEAAKLIERRYPVVVDLVGKEHLGKKAVQLSSTITGSWERRLTSGSVSNAEATQTYNEGLEFLRQELARASPSEHRALANHLLDRWLAPVSENLLARK